LPTLADYAAGMRKARSRKSRRDGDQKSDTRNEIVLTAESALPPKKPPAPSAKRRLHRGRRAKLMK
jgi:hypothetical protein